MHKDASERWRSPDGLTLLAGWARDGLSPEQIAENCGCSTAMLSRWRQKFPEIDAALSRTRTLVDYEVENALLRRALGYSYTETVDDNGKRKETVKQQAPDMSAVSFWLRNRLPKKWTDKPQPDGMESLEKLDALMQSIDAAAADALRDSTEEGGE